jgi:hypothetical protein
MQDGYPVALFYSLLFEEDGKAAEAGKKLLVCPAFSPADDSLFLREKTAGLF